MDFDMQLKINETTDKRISNVCKDVLELTTQATRGVKMVGTNAETIQLVNDRLNLLLDRVDDLERSERNRE